MTIRLPALVLLLLAAFAAVPASAHDNVPAPPQRRPVVIDGATVHPQTGPPIAAGRVRFEAGRLVAIGGDEVPLDGADRIDAIGKHVYPGLIAANSVLGLVEIEAVRATVDHAEVGENAANVRAEVAVNPDSELIPVSRANGVLLALTVPRGSGITGTSALLQLEGWTGEEMTVAAPVALHVVWPGAEIPSWLPEEQQKAAREAGRQQRDAIRRAFEQAAAYRQAGGAAGNQPEDLRLSAMQPFLARSRPVFFHADSAGAIGEALAFAAEHGLRAVIVGGLEAWRVTDALRAADVPVIVGGTHMLPMRRFDAPDAIYANPARLAAAGVRFAIAIPDDGFELHTANLRNLPYHAATAVAHGLPRDEAMRAITLYPAQILGVNDRVGALEVGLDATLFIASGDPLEITSEVERAWIGGREIDLRSRQTRLYEKYRQKYPETREAR
jgi:imidazolonepropionase-like amidohydrolase